jgi:uracil-DNA glycosylase
MAEPSGLDTLLEQVAACRLCAEHLPLGPRPVVQLHADAPILIIGQAPGTKVHESGIPWNDPSGDRLREWLGVDKDIFYDPTKVALMPMGFCYPGRVEKGGDAPPRKECAPHWHPQLLPALPRLRLTLLVGQYAHAYYLGRGRKRTLGDTVRAWEEYLPTYWPTPHPSWRVTNWMTKNPWYEEQALPALKKQVRELLE